MSKLTLYALKASARKINRINEILKNISCLERDLAREENLNCLELEYYRHVLQERRNLLEKVANSYFEKLLAENFEYAAILGDIEEKDGEITFVPFSTMRISGRELENNQMIFPVLLKKDHKYSGETALKVLDLETGVISDYKDS